MRAADRRGATSRRQTVMLVGIPLVLVFLASAGIMVVELVVARLIARHVGTSLYTWTSIIGVVLAGVSVGNIVGGVLADRLGAARVRAAIGFLFLAAGALSVSVLWVHWWAFDVSLGLNAAWPARILVGVVLTVFLPAVALGAIGPMVATWTLHRTEVVGGVVGSLYSSSSLGAIAGTLVTGYWLIATFGTSTVLQMVGLIFAITGFLLHTSRRSVGGLVVVVVLMWLATPLPGLNSAVPGLVPRPLFEDPGVVYVDESAYQSIAIVRTQDGVLALHLDDLIHGYIDVRDDGNLLYPYLRIFGSIIDASGIVDVYDRSAFLALGGGAYTFPRYLHGRYPFSETVTVEVDPHVTRASRAAMGLRDEPRLEVMHYDARQAVSILRDGGRQFDVVLADAFRDVAVPHHLTTREFMLQVQALLSVDGMMLSNVIDNFDVGRFLGAYVNTKAQVFPHVWVVAPSPLSLHAARETFVVVGSNTAIDLDVFNSAAAAQRLPWHVLDDDEMATLRERSRGLVLTDDFAPVEHLLASWQGPK